MNLRISILIFAAAFFVQPLLNLYLPNGTAPDIDLCIVTVIALVTDHETMVKPLAAAFFFALIADVCYNIYIGPSVLAMLSVVVLVLIVRRFFNTENLLLDIGCAAAAFFLYNSAYWAICRAFGAAYTYAYMLRRLPAGLAVNTALTGLVLFFILNKAAQARRDSYFK